MADKNRIQDKIINYPCTIIKLMSYLIWKVKAWVRILNAAGGWWVASWPTLYKYNPDCHHAIELGHQGSRYFTFLCFCPVHWIITIRETCNNVSKHTFVLLPRLIIFGQNVTGAPEFCMMAARAGWLLQRLTVKLVRPVRKHKRIRWASRNSELCMTAVSLFR